MSDMNIQMICKLLMLCHNLIYIHIKYLSLTHSLDTLLENHSLAGEREVGEGTVTSLRTSWGKLMSDS